MEKRKEKAQPRLGFLLAAGWDDLLLVGRSGSGSCFSRLGSIGGRSGSGGGFSGLGRFGGGSGRGGGRGSGSGRSFFLLGASGNGESNESGDEQRLFHLGPFIDKDVKARIFRVAGLDAGQRSSLAQSRRGSARQGRRKGSCR